MKSPAFLVAAVLLHLGAAWAAEPVTIPAGRHQGRIILSPRIGDSAPLRFLLDSACTIPTLHPALVDELKLTPSGRVRIQGIAGEERAPTFSGVVFDFGPVQYTPRRVASIPSEREERRRRDGVLDAGFFRRFVVEWLPDADSIRLHAPADFTYTGPGQAVPIRFHEEIPVIRAALQFPGEEPVEAEFEIDTGCDSGLCLGEPFVRRLNLLEKIEGRSSEKFGVGGSVETRHGHIPVLRIGGAEITRVQADFFSQGSPVDEPMAGHIGMGAIAQRRMIFDYTRKRIIIE